jgi:hypothetical protein
LKYNKKSKQMKKRIFNKSLLLLALVLFHVGAYAQIGGGPPGGGTGGGVTPGAPSSPIDTNIYILGVVVVLMIIYFVKNKKRQIMCK